MGLTLLNARSSLTFNPPLGIYLYGLVASVIKKNGMLATKQNIVIGWGVPAFIILFNMCFEYENYGGTYHCWLQMDKGKSHL